MKAIVALSATLAVALSNAQQVFGDETRAWMVGPAKAVSSGMVTNFEFSGSGNRIIYSRIDPNSMFSPDQIKPPVMERFVFDTAKGTNTPIKIPGISEQAVIALLGDDRTIYFADNGDPKYQGFYNLDSGVVTRLSAPTDNIVYYGDNPLAQFLLVSTAEDSVSLVAPGRAVQSFKVPRGARFLAPIYSDAQVVKFQAYAQSDKLMLLREITFGLRTGESRVRDLTHEEWNKLVAAEVRVPFELSGDENFSMLGLPAPIPVKGGPSARPASKKGYLDRTAPVCPTKFRVQLEPKGRSIAYVDNGALLLREVRPFDHDLAEKMKIAAMKSEALNKSKQLGLALIMYAADMDDVLPNGENFVSRLLPYLKDRKMIDNFNYTFAGGSMSQIANPATTELGFTNGPGGRAVVYADGHAKWINDKP